MHSLILAWASYILALLLPAQRAEVSLYNETFVVEYQSLLFANGPLGLDEAGIGSHYAAVTEKDWLPLHDQLQHQRSRLGLNDWLYVKLVRQTVDAVAGFAAENERRVLEFHLLTLAGFDARLCYDAHDVYVYAHTADALFEVPMITHGERRYVNLTAALSPRSRTARSLSLHPLRPLPYGVSLSFDLSELPGFAPDVQARTFRFRYGGELHTVHGLSDRTIAAWMNDYPFFEEGRYVETPMSPTTSGRLLAELRPMLEGKSERESLALLAAFTRSAFEYKEDKQSFGYSKPMIADEVLYYPVSDCEDRSALYFTLVRELLDLPVIAIAYDDHLSVAVASEELASEELGGEHALYHEGRRYFVCDPTGPKESVSIGAPPAGYADRPYDIVAAYAPTVRT